ncbi:MAG: CPBP family intramembrane metalloprotease [Parachlamydia sp.]|nr:CPBP family intramembrane metalloprotease [Parachlamydia sp.]
MQEHLHFLIASLFFAAFVSLAAWRNDFFHLGKERIEANQRPTLNNAASAFLLFLGIEVILVPAVAALYMLSKSGWEIGRMRLDSLAQGWFGLITIIASAIALVGYSLALPAEKRRTLYWGTLSPRPFRDIFFGAASWLISYPWVLVISNLVALIMLLFGPLPETDQVAVKQLKSSMQDPLLFGGTVFAIIFLVPLAEEILFRGILQRSLARYLGRWRAIGISSLIFAFFHFSTTQGWNNIELILSLFILSCYLGLIYEKRGSIWTPVGLHMAFNSVSIAFILSMGGDLP